MTDIDTFIREFRSELDEPGPGAEQRIVRRLARPPRRRPGLQWRIPRLALVGGLAAGICTAGALVPTFLPDDPGGTAPSLLARAEAAVSSPSTILALTIRMHSTTTEEAVTPKDRDRTVVQREWTLAGTGDAMRYRTLISEAAPDAPPTDEDSTVVLARDGSFADQRSWTPDDGGVLSVTTGDALREQSRALVAGGGTAAASMTVVGMLRQAYRAGELKPAGRTADGLLRLTGGPFLGGSDCGTTEVELDPDTFIPRRLESMNYFSDDQTACDLSSPPVAREHWTITARALPATAENRRLLELGNWPTARIEADDHDYESKNPPLDSAPPVPPLDQG